MISTEDDVPILKVLVDRVLLSETPWSSAYARDAVPQEHQGYFQSTATTRLDIDFERYLGG